jgi:hypothetical protein
MTKKEISLLPRLGEDAKDALPDIRKLRLSSDPEIRDAATSAIEKIEGADALAKAAAPSKPVAPATAKPQHPPQQPQLPPQPPPTQLTPPTQPMQPTQQLRPSDLPRPGIEGVKWSLGEFQDQMEKAGVKAKFAERREASVPGVWMTPADRDDSPILVQLYPSAADAIAASKTQADGKNAVTVWGRFVLVGTEGPLWRAVRKALGS